MAGQKKPLPAELENVASAETVSAIQDKVDKCYSSEKYEEFQGAVEKITLRYLKGKVGWAAFLWVTSIVGTAVGTFMISKI